MIDYSKYKAYLEFLQAKRIFMYFYISIMDHLFKDVGFYYVDTLSLHEMRIRLKRCFVLIFTSFFTLLLLQALQNQVLIYSPDAVNEAQIRDAASNSRRNSANKLSLEVREFLGEVRKLPNISTESTALVWPKSNPLENDRIVAQLRYKPTAQGVKRIFVANGLPDELRTTTSKLVTDKCAITDCVFTGNMAEARMADAIIWMNGITRMPFHKPSHQIWIMFYLESPIHTPSVVEYNNLINWTATYRRDSVLVTPYEKFAHFENFTSLPKAPQKNYALNKTKNVGWFVSNCNSMNGRLEYAHELQKYIDVDIYGACGNLECKRGPDDQCFKMLNRDYKFYLSFENSNCIDYITEKFYWNGLL